MSDVVSFSEGREIKVQGRIVRGLRGHVIKSTLSFLFFLLIASESRFVKKKMVSSCNV